MILENENIVLQVKLGGAVTTNELPVIVTCEENFIGKIVADVENINSSNKKTQFTLTNGTGAVDILDAPEVDYKREIKFLTIFNADTVAAQIILQFYDGSANITLKITIQTGETLQYNKEQGFSVLDSQGQIKTSLSSFAANIEDAINDGVTDKAPSENAVFDALALKIDLTAIDTDGTLAANSDSKIASQKATKTFGEAMRDAAKAYADSLVVGLWDDRGNFDASVDAYPSSGGSGTAGAILKGDIWTVSNLAGGTMPTGQVVNKGDTIRALVDTPGNTQANWAIGENNIGYVPENSANKSTDVNADQASNTKYTSVKAVYDWVISIFSNSKKSSLEIMIDGQGGVITTGLKGFITCPYAGTITGWQILGDQSGSCVVDIWKDTYANFPPTVADTIAGSEKPTLSTQQSNNDLSLSSWTTSIAVGDIIAYNVDSATTLTKVKITIFITKT